MQGGYFDRGTPGATLCDDCARVRWGDPLGTEWESDQAFLRRYNDSSGDWCWAPWAMEDCAQCS